MRLFRKKNKRVSNSPKSPRPKMDRTKFVWVMIGGVFIGGYFLTEVLKYYSLKDRLSTQQKESAQVKDNIAKLETQRDKLNKADPDTIEKQAREQLKYTRPNEVIYVPAEDTGKDTTK